MIKVIEKMFRPDNLTTYITVGVESWEDMMRTGGSYELTNQIIKLLAEEYVKEHGDMILKSIQEKTLDSKVIAKVVENLRKELKK